MAAAVMPRGGGFRLFLWLLAVALFAFMVVEMRGMQRSFRSTSSSSAADTVEELLMETQDSKEGSSSSRPGISRARLIHELDRLEMRLNQSKQENEQLVEQLSQLRVEASEEILLLENQVSNMTQQFSEAERNATYTTERLSKVQADLAKVKEQAKFDPWFDRLILDQKINELKRLEVLLAKQKGAGMSLPEGFYLHDKSLEALLDPTVHRLWFDNATEKPKVQLLLTNLGWNQRNQQQGLLYHRSQRETRILKGLINHPWFHPTAWQDINIHRNVTMDPNVRYYVFADWAQCLDGNWPEYGGQVKNLDTEGNRTKQNNKERRIWDIFQYPMFNKTLNGENQATFITFDCGGWGPSKANLEKRTNDKLSMSVASLSANIREANPRWDQGLPPAAGVQVQLSEEEVADIESCAAETEESRPLLLTYIGNFRGGPKATLKDFGPRGMLGRLHDGKETFILRHFLPEFKNSKIGHLSYRDILAQSRFSAAPRGDNKFSYRFSEVLSAGAIPVIMADDWLWPFRPELVDWSECAVILRENAALDTLKVIANLTLDQRCRMRQKCYEIYKNYFEDDRGVVTGLVEGLELVAEGKRAEFSGIHCMPGDDPDSYCNFQRRRIRHR